MGDKFSRILPVDDDDPSASLILGSMDYVVDDSVLEQYKIKCVLSVMEAPPDEMGSVLQRNSIGPENHMIYHLEDSAERFISIFNNDMIYKVTEWLHLRRCSGLNVLVHCDAGITRSPSVVIAYLMRYGTDLFNPSSMPYKVAHDLVSLRHHEINISLFASELAKLEALPLCAESPTTIPIRDLKPSFSQSQIPVPIIMPSRAWSLADITTSMRAPSIMPVSPVQMSSPTKPYVIPQTPTVPTENRPSSGATFGSLAPLFTIALCSWGCLVYWWWMKSNQVGIILVASAGIVPLITGLSVFCLPNYLNLIIVQLVIIVMVIYSMVPHFVLGGSTGSGFSLSALHLVPTALIVMGLNKGVVVLSILITWILYIIIFAVDCSKEPTPQHLLTGFHFVLICVSLNLLIIIFNKRHQAELDNILLSLIEIEYLIRGNIASEQDDSTDRPPPEIWNTLFSVSQLARGISYWKPFVPAAVRAGGRQRTSSSDSPVPIQNPNALMDPIQLNACPRPSTSVTMDRMGVSVFGKFPNASRPSYDCFIPNNSIPGIVMPAAPAIPLEATRLYRKTITILAVTLSGFWEAIAPLQIHEVTMLTSAMLSVVAEVIIRFGGYLHNYNGETFIAIWSLQSQCSKACEAASEIIPRIQLLLSESDMAFQLEPKAALTMVETIVGTVHGSKRYGLKTVLTPDIQFATDVSQSSDWGVSVLIDDAVQNAVKDKIIGIPVDVIQREYSNSHTVIYALCNNVNPDTDPDWSNYMAGFNRLLSGRPEEAIHYFEMAADSCIPNTFIKIANRLATDCNDPSHRIVREWCSTHKWKPRMEPSSVPS